jgi:pimeloyl-ACP methyl ester carboxylesterase
MKIENPSLNQIFEKDRARYIPEIGKQLKEGTSVKIKINGEKLKVDYRIISIAEKERKDADPVILLPGFGSGWEGISELGFSLAVEGRKVVMLSLPGYGNSGNPEKEYYKTDNFDNEAEVIKKLAENIPELNNRKFHLVGHSMACEIIASFGEKYPDKVSSLVLLTPAGVKGKENLLSLGSRFGLDGIVSTGEYKLETKFSGEKDYQDELKEYIPETKSPFSKERREQRISEGRRLSRGHLLEKLNNTNFPITYIAGRLDMVYPPDKQLKEIIEGVNDKTRIEKSVMAGLRHNTTIAPDEITAANIEHYIQKAEEGRK